MPSRRGRVRRRALARRLRARLGRRDPAEALDDEADHREHDAAAPSRRPPTRSGRRCPARRSPSAARARARRTSRRAAHPCSRTPWRARRCARRAGRRGWAACPAGTGARATRARRRRPRCRARRRRRATGTFGGSAPREAMRPQHDPGADRDARGQEQQGLPAGAVHHESGASVPSSHRRRAVAVRRAVRRPRPRRGAPTASRGRASGCPHGRGPSRPAPRPVRRRGRAAPPAGPPAPTAPGRTRARGRAGAAARGRRSRPARSRTR